MDTSFLPRPLETFWRVHVYTQDPEPLFGNGLPVFFFILFFQRMFPMGGVGGDTEMSGGMS